jgi:hypothetical protein
MSEAVQFVKSRQPPDNRPMECNFESTDSLELFSAFDVLVNFPLQRIT